MKNLLLAFAAALGLCAFGSPAHAGTEYVTGDQRPAPPQREGPRTYIPLLPPLPFLPVPTLVIGGHGPAPAVVPIGAGVIAGPAPVVYARPYYRRRRFRRYGYPYPYGPVPYGYYGGPGVPY